MNKKFLVILVSSVFLGLSNISYGATNLAQGTPQIYKVILTKFEISSDGGNTYITLYEGNSVEIDIASANAGEAAGNFFSGLSVPDGTYTHVKATPSATFKMKGSVSYGGTTYYTASDGASTTTAANLAEASITVPGGVTGTGQALPTSITVKSGVADHSVRVEFNVSNTLALWDGDDPGSDPDTFYPEAPSVTLSVH